MGSDQVLLKQLQGCDLGPKSLQPLQRFQEHILTLSGLKSVNYLF